MAKSPRLPTSEVMSLDIPECKGVIKRAKSRPGKGYLKSLPPAPRIKGDLLEALIADREEAR